VSKNSYSTNNMEFKGSLPDTQHQLPSSQNVLCDTAAYHQHSRFNQLPHINTDQGLINSPKHKGLLPESHIHIDSTFPLKFTPDNQSIHWETKSPAVNSKLQYRQKHNGSGIHNHERNRDYMNHYMQADTCTTPICYDTARHELPIQRSYSNHTHKEPDKFDGKSTDWRDYIIHFENVSRWNGWNSLEKAQQLTMSLRGPAQKLLSDLNSDQFTNFELLKETLGRRFNPIERETAFRCEFRNRKQKRQESASDFGFTLQRLCSLAFPGVHSDAREIYVIDQFINGLSRPEIRSHVQFRHPSTIDAAIALAVEFEAFEGSQGILKKPHFEDENSLRVISENSSSKGHQSRSDSVSLNDLAKLIENLTVAVKRSYSRSKSRDRSNSRDRQNLSQIECYNCHQKGHIASKCPNPRQEN
jgi:hypothetical protein